MNDFQLDIATAANRRASVWKNRKWRWSEIVERCRTPQRSAETMGEYLRLSRDLQNDLKDVGGFVGGYLTDGKRKTANVQLRSMLTFDIDNAAPGLWEDFTLNHPCAAMVYSTRKHTPEKPRLRLILPADRPMLPAEYEPVARRWASRLGIEQFDQTTYDLARLFYWPSVCHDGEYFFDVQDGPAFSVDEVLATYRNYLDVSEWPLSSREGEARKREQRELGDPLAKPGIIGAFCRAYTIEEAIEKFLGDIYEPTATEGRYTYTKGSTFGGVITYEGKFARSFHATDPAGGKLHNAFDFVRLSLYGDLDDNSRVTDPTRLPSYIKMMERAAADPEVRGLLTRERLAQASEDFAGIKPLGQEEGADERWMAQLEYDRSGKLISSANNIITILENDPGLKGHLWHDLFSGFDMVRGGLPWDTKATQWGNRDDANLRIYLERRYGLTGKDRIKDSKDAVLTQHQKHPVREYLSALQWDGKPRLERLIIDYVGADDNELTRAMTRKHFTAAVARVMNPGCKYDYCLVLQGDEGIGKSTLFHIMGGEWFNDSITTMENKSGMEQLRRAWIVELGELGALKRSEVELVKAYITRQDDIYRPAYGQVVESHPRQNVFCGSTNESFFLKGNTGNRRFWVIAVDPSLRKYDNLVERLEADRDQLWAEAVELWKKGEKLYLTKELEAQARLRQQEFNDDSDDPLAETLRFFMDMPLPADWEAYDLIARRSYSSNPGGVADRPTIIRDRICPAEFICERLGHNIAEKEYKYLARRVSDLIRAEGWEGPRTSRHAENLYGRQKTYFRPIAQSDEDL